MRTGRDYVDADMATFITRLETTGTGLRLAVKDLIDMAGLPTTAGCRAVADTAQPAEADAPCLAGARAAGARIVGKVNLHELAYGTSGINPWYGTPRNPIDPDYVPGGSSSGSAVAVAEDEADVAYGSDTGGSVRIPSACCGTAGLKTTHGRISIEGVWPLAESLDTIGPMARDVAGLVTGMQLLEPGFAAVPAAAGPRTIGRFRVAGTDPAIDEAIDRALAEAEFEVVDIDLRGWRAAFDAGVTILSAEAYANDARLVAERPAGIGADVLQRIQFGATLTAEQVATARDAAAAWRQELAELFGRVEAVALPTLPGFPPRVDDGGAMVVATLPGNVAGVPALSIPVPTRGQNQKFPASLQLMGPWNSEERLLAAGVRIESAIR